MHKYPVHRSTSVFDLPSRADNKVMCVFRMLSQKGSLSSQPERISTVHFTLRVTCSQSSSHKSHNSTNTRTGTALRGMCKVCSQNPCVVRSSVRGNRRSPSRSLIASHQQRTGKQVVLVGAQRNTDLWNALLQQCPASSVASPRRTVTSLKKMFNVPWYVASKLA